MSRPLRARGPAAPRDPVPASPLRLALPCASQQMREVQPWPSLANIARASTLDRRSVIHIIREFEKRGVFDVRSRNVAPRKAGAT